MTKREAIRECKKLWKEIEKSGLDKFRFLGSPAGEKWQDKGYQDYCPLCEYVRNGIGCVRCPLQTQHNKDCYKLGYSKRNPLSFFEAIRNLRG